VLRRFAIAAGVLAALAVVATVLVVLNLNRIIEANRERIIAGMSDGFARPVTVERIATGFHGGIAMEMEGLRIADDPAFSTEDFLAADRVHVIVRFWPLVHGRVEVRRIAVRAPRLTIVRTAQGMNVDSLGRRTEAAKLPAGVGGEPSAQASMPALAIALVNLEDGVVRFVDRTNPTASETTITPLNVRLSDLSLTTPMRMEIEATASGKSSTTVRIRGTVGPIGDPPFAADVPIEQHVAVAGGAVEVADLTITGSVRRPPTGRPAANVHVAAASVRTPAVELTNLDVVVAERDGVAMLDRLAFGVFGGTIAGRARVDHSRTPPAFLFETTVRDMDVSQAMAKRAPAMAARFQGRLDADCSIGGTGSDETTVRRTLLGKGHVVIRDGRLTGVNIAESVLTGVTGVSGVVTLVPARVRERYPAIFATEDTRFDELGSDVRIGNERIQVESVNVVARDYALRGKGVITFAQQADLTATLVASTSLTADIVGMLKEASYLTDSTAHLAIPFRFAGTLPNVRPKPDPDFVTRVVEKALVGEGLDRLLGGGKRDDGKQPNGKGTEDLLKRGLDKIFRR
jgi:AsmA protein